MGRKLKLDTRLDLFAATPPLESLKAIVSICASHQWTEEPFMIMSVDIKRAYFYAKARRAVYIEIPQEDREAGDEWKVGKLNLSLYGTRDAAQNWAAEYTATLCNAGFVVGRASPCNFHHPEWKVCTTVHGDDFTATGPETGLLKMRKALEGRHECKTDLLGPNTNKKSGSSTG